MLDSYRLSCQGDMRKIHAYYRMLFLGVTAALQLPTLLTQRQGMLRRHCSQQYREKIGDEACLFNKGPSGS
jgi:hypothetical protein